jgi:hypothetical protein
MKLTSEFAAVVFLCIILLAGCNSSPPSTPQVENAMPVPQERKVDIGLWHVQEPETSPIDGTKTQMLSTGTTGSRLVLCFENGRLCGGSNAGVFVTSPCWVEGGEEEFTQHKRRIRLRFDEDKFLVETWGISDDHRGIFPFSPKNFVSSLKRHKVLAVEFGCARYDSDVVTFYIDGLQAALESAGLKPDQGLVSPEKSKGKTILQTAQTPVVSREEEARSWRTQISCESAGFGWEDGARHAQK